MALLGIFILTACDEPDSIKSTPETPAQGTDKRLKRILIYTPDDILHEVFDYKYNKQGNVSEIEHKYYDEYSDNWDNLKYTYSYSENLISATYDDTRFEHHLYNGKVERTDFVDLEDESYDYEEFSRYFTYNNNGYIEKVSGGDQTQKYNWSNDKLLSWRTTGDYTSENTITYSKQKCNGFFPLFAILTECGNEYLFFAQPQLVGAATSYLPTEIKTKFGTMTFSDYEFDSDGYVIKVTDDDESFVEFVWE